MIIKSIVICSILLFVGLTSNGQKIDSLRELLLKKTGLERVDVLCELSNNHLDSDPNAALAFAAEGYSLSVTLSGAHALRELIISRSTSLNFWICIFVIKKQ